MRKVLLVAVFSVLALPCSVFAEQEQTVTSAQTFDQLLQSAQQARDENHDEDAIRLFRRALSQEPESEQALWFLSTLLYEKGQYAEARNLLRQFLTIRPDAGPGWALLGLSEFQLREYSRALDHLQRAMSQGMGDRKELIQVVFDRTAVLLTRFERYDDSMDMILKMLSSGSTDSSLVEPAGLAGLRLPLLPSEIPPDRRELVDLAGQAVIALQTRHYEEADSQFKRLLSSYPNEPGVHFLYGAYLMELHPHEAVPQFERELQISPSHVLARVRLAEELIAEDHFDRALLLARQAITLDPKRASAHLLAGEALIHDGNISDGIKELETARDENHGLTRARWDLLRAYAASGRKEDADREKQEIEKMYKAESSGPRNQLSDAPTDRDERK